MKEDVITKLINAFIEEADAKRYDWQDTLRRYGSKLIRHDYHSATSTIISDNMESDDDMNFSVNKRTLRDSHSSVVASQSVSVQSNELYPAIDTMASTVVPQNPQIEIKSYHDDEETRKAVQERQKLVNHIFKLEQTNEVLSEVVARCAMFSYASVKTTWSAHLERPTFSVGDRRSVWFDRRARKLEAMRYVIEVCPMTSSMVDSLVKNARAGEAKASISGQVLTAIKKRLHDGAGEYPKWMTNGLEDKILDAESWVCLYEVHIFGDNPCWGFFDVIEKKWLIKWKSNIYNLVKNPYHIITMSTNLEDLNGLSEADLINPYIQQVEAIESQVATIASQSSPMLVFNKALLRNGEQVAIELVESSKGYKFVAVDSINPNVPLDNIVKIVIPEVYSGQFASTLGSLYGKIQNILALPEYTRGSITGSGPATEYRLADIATKNRSGRRMQKLFWLIGKLGATIIDLLDEFLKETATIGIDVGDTLKKTNRASLGLPPQSLMGSTRDQFSVRVQGYSPQDDLDPIQLSLLVPLLSALLNMPVTDPVVLNKEILRMLRMDRAIKTDGAAAGAQPPGQPGLPPGSEGGMLPQGAGGVPGGIQPRVGMNPNLNISSQIGDGAAGPGVTPNPGGA